MGDQGQRLHEWFFASLGGNDAELMKAYWARVGAVVLGMRMFENGLESWCGKNPWGVPAFVLSHEEREPMSNNGDTQFTFVTEGIESALERARAVAGDKDVAIAGGANTIRQVLAAGLLDEIHLHIVPLFLGGGTRLFDRAVPDRIDLEPVRATQSSAIVHLEYRINR